MISNLIASMNHPEEIKAMMKLYLNGQFQHTATPDQKTIKQISDREFSYQILNRVSRSFAAVIHELPTEVQDAVCAFYLVLRGLDSVEDDMSIELEKRNAMLRTFHVDMMDKDSDFTGIGDTDDYRLLMKEFHKVAGFLKKLDPKYQAVIIDICKRMGEGMAEFSKREVVTSQDFDLYCHYVAGLVGHGLSDLFAASGMENPRLSESKDIANSMGLFLQKANIIRDYHEDLTAERMFWPSAIWRKAALSIDEFNTRPEAPESLAVLNELVTDAMRHLPDCIAYLRLLKNPAIFRFCAIPQAMALATLIEVYNNPKVFTQNVKIRKGLAAKIMVEIKTIEDMSEFIQKQSETLQSKISLTDPSCGMMVDYLHKAVVKLAQSPVVTLDTEEEQEYRKVS